LNTWNRKYAYVASLNEGDFSHMTNCLWAGVQQLNRHTHAYVEIMNRAEPLTSAQVVMDIPML
jgi:hypothetical protein